MKKILTVFCLVISIHTSNAQVLISLLFGDDLNTGKIEFGLDGGLNYTTIRGLDGAEYAPNFNLGFYFDIKLKNPSWMVHTGVLVKSNLGAKGIPVYSLNNPDLDDAFKDGSIERKVNYFIVPITIKQLIKQRVFWEVGIAPSLRSKANDIFTADIDGELQYKKDIGDELNRLDFGLIGGVGYRIFKGYGINLAVRYLYGVVDMTKDNSQPAQYNESIYFAVGIPIGVKKAREKQAAKQKAAGE